MVLTSIFAIAFMANVYWVSPIGKDSNPGTKDLPFASLERAQLAMRENHGTVYLRDGVYYLSKPLVFTTHDSGTRDKPTTYQAYGDEKPVISGGIRLSGLTWKPYKGGILQAQVPSDLETEEIFVNGKRQILARYPNYDPTAKYFDGFAANTISKERAAHWGEPAGGYYHAMHPNLWGDFAWLITGKNPDGSVALTGGWQNNRGGAINLQIGFVENIFEELDSPGEWFLNHNTHTLYFYPPSGVNITSAVVEATCLRNLVCFHGSDSDPVRFVTLKGLTFRQSARTFMGTKEPLLRSDWAIYRGGAVLFDGAEDCTLQDSFIDQVGGNAIFVNNYNRRVTIRSCHIERAGASGICFVGDPKAARSALFNYDQSNNLEQIDRTPGPKRDNYPSDCLVDDCLINLTGRVEKQTAGVEIDLAKGITVRHCSIYDMPRAGINIGDGCWGGHVIEFCDIFDTVKETGDHGSFNSWGRDRYWLPDINAVNEWVRQVPSLPKLDAETPNVLRNSRWRCDHGWDIDLDDGSSNYVIKNNLCLHGGIKNREGYNRVVENNVIIDNGFHPHVWYAKSGDIFKNNIVWNKYLPALMHPAPWGAVMDNNLMQVNGLASTEPAVALQNQSGRDEYSVVADALFVNPSSGDYRVKSDSPALKLGFANFPMDRFGVQTPSLKAISRTPLLPGQLANHEISRDPTHRLWLGVSVRNIANEGEMSALGLPGVTGVLLLKVDPKSVLAKSGLRSNDVVLSLNGQKISDVDSLLRLTTVNSGRDLDLTISRSQKLIPLNVSF
jgi:hypothetical protein